MHSWNYNTAVLKKKFILSFIAHRKPCMEFFPAQCTELMILHQAGVHGVRTGRVRRWKACVWITNWYTASRSSIWEVNKLYGCQSAAAQPPLGTAFISSPGQQRATKPHLLTSADKTQTVPEECLQSMLTLACMRTCTAIQWRAQFPLIQQCALSRIAVIFPVYRVRAPERIRPVLYLLPNKMWQRQHSGRGTIEF